MANGTEPTLEARPVEAARLISRFLGDLCVVAMASEDRLQHLADHDENDRCELHGPEAFMPVAERFDLTEAIDRWVLRRTVAEFVPDQQTLELLSELGVDVAQGFHVGRPRPLKEH